MGIRDDGSTGTRTDPSEIEYQFDDYTESASEGPSVSETRLQPHKGSEREMSSFDRSFYGLLKVVGLEEQYDSTAMELLKMVYAIAVTIFFLALLTYHFDQAAEFSMTTMLDADLNGNDLRDVQTVDGVWEWLITVADNLLASSKKDSAGFSGGAGQLGVSHAALTFAVRSGLNHLSEFDEAAHRESMPDFAPTQIKDHCFFGTQNLVVGGVGIHQRRRGVRWEPEEFGVLERLYGGLPAETSFKGVPAALSTILEQYQLWKDDPDSTDLDFTPEESLNFQQDPRIFEQCFTQDQLEASLEQQELCDLQSPVSFSDEQVAEIQALQAQGANITNITIKMFPFGHATLAAVDSQREHRVDIELLHSNTEVELATFAASQYSLEGEEPDADNRLSVCEEGCEARQLCRDEGTVDSLEQDPDCIATCMDNALEFAESECWAHVYSVLFAAFPEPCSVHIRDQIRELCEPSKVRFAGPQTYTTNPSKSDKTDHAAIARYNSDLQYLETYYPRATIYSEELATFLDGGLDVTQPFVVVMEGVETNKTTGVEVTGSCDNNILGGVSQWILELEVVDVEGNIKYFKTETRESVAMHLRSQFGTCLRGITQPLTVSLVQIHDDHLRPNSIKGILYSADPCNDDEAIMCHHYWGTAHKSHSSACGIVREFLPQAIAEMAGSGSPEIQSVALDAKFNCHEEAADFAPYVHLMTPYNEETQAFSTYLNCLPNEQSGLAEAYVNLMMLKENGWIDSLSSELEVSFIIYNGNHDIMSLVEVFFEMDQLGSIEGTLNIFSSQVKFFNDKVWQARVILEVLVIISVSASVIAEIMECSPWKGLGAIRHYFSKAHNYTDLGRIFFMFVLLALRVELMDSSDNLLASANEVIELESSGVTDEDVTIINPLVEEFRKHASLVRSYKILAAVCIFVHVFWILKYFKHPRLAVVTRTLKRTSGDMWHAGIVFVVILGAYASLGSLLFGQDIGEYRSTSSSFVATSRILFGDFDYDALKDVYGEGLETIIFFWSFQIIAFLVMFNIVLAIVVNAYTKYQEQTKQMIPEPNVFIDFGAIIRPSFFKEMKKKRAVQRKAELEAENN